MKYFLTGHPGFVGTHLNERLPDRVYLYSRGQDTSIVSEFQPDIIFHLAAEIYDDKAMFDSNIKLTYDLLEEARKLPNLQAFIYVGSSSEYGAKDHPMSETDFLDPRTMYEATKGAGTLLCQAYARAYGVQTAIARPFSLYGQHEPPHRFIPTIVDRLRKGKRINIAPGVHDFIHIDDFIDGLLLLSGRFNAGEVFNFGTGTQTSNYELVSLIGEIMKVEPKRRLIESLHTYDSDHWVCDNTRARSIGWKPKMSLLAGLTRLIKEGK